MIKAPLIFNDLSLIEADSVDTARHWFTETIKAIAELIQQQVCTSVLYAKQDFYEILITDDYGFIEWLNELDYQDELRLLAQRLTTRTPIHADLAKIDSEDFCRSEFRLKTPSKPMCDALGVALISDGISVSLPSQPQWCMAFIEIEQILYDADLNPENTVQHRVRSVSQVEQVDPVVRDWRCGVGEKSHHAEDLLARWKEAFPHLDLCHEYSDKFLPSLKGDTFKSVLKRLRELDDDCHRWVIEERTEVVYSMRARPESNDTMKRKPLANMRFATCPNNGEQDFVMHCDIQPKGYRLYWFEDRQRRRLTMCYAGPHLETVGFKAQ